ncbi:hypothetical protein [Anaeromicropila herbilytica]|uniref:Uncharacterized protein n=1 Tax=Anaeromicropila herbilytica TaxID=2785025 RepID=A0A7R7EN75_9FIRM|nr:hypothetical protein [Anaeromicropila herbilytica]BCN31844.1 hypothetical protein bsdtb5_31390 [Anaeromicropila herbilytica]
MEKLFVEMNQKLIPIDDAIVQKYNLKEGTLTPLTNQRIVDISRNFIHEKDRKEINSLDYHDSEIDEMENGLMLSTSEMIDIAEGSDSYPDANQDD